MKEKSNNGTKPAGEKAITALADGKDPRSEFLHSDDFVVATTKMYTIYYLVTQANLMLEDIYSILGTWGPTDMNSMNQDLMAMGQAFDRFEKKFTRKMLPKGADNHKERLECICDGCDTLQQAIDQMLNETIRQGRLYVKHVAMREQMGGRGCDTCRLWHTEHCVLSQVFRYPEDTSCLGYREKGGAQ